MRPCVWYVSKYVVTPAGGEPVSRGYGIMREIAEQGYRSVLVTSDSMGMLDAPGAHQRYVFEDRDGMQLCRIRTLKYQAAKSIRRMLSWIDFEWKLMLLPSDALPPPDAVVVSSLSLLTIFNGLLLRRRHGCRLVFEVRDIWPLTLTEEGGFSRGNPLVLGLGAIERLGYRRADAIVGTMPNLGAHVKEVTGEALPTYCVPMGVDIKAIESPEPLPTDYASKYLPPGKFTVAYAGSIGISNALDVFFDCIKRMGDDPRVHFVVLGEGDLRPAFEAKYGSLANLTFAPRIPKAMVNDFLTRCDLLYLSVHKSAVWDYGLSLNKLIDYMLAARPIVASYSGYPSMIDEARCGTFVPARDAAALEQEIRRFALMPVDERETIGARGRNWILEHRTFKVLANDYLEILFPGPRPNSQTHHEGPTFEPPTDPLTTTGLPA